MNYEQKYNEALERAKKIHDSPNASNGRKEWLESIFPELAESEDERVREEMIAYFEDIKEVATKSKSLDEWIAYLEKQKEPAPIPDKFSGLKSLMLQYLQSAANRKDDSEIESDTDLWGRKILDYVWKYDGKQKEQQHPNGCFTCDEYKKGYESGRLNGFTAGYNKAIKEVEQKPAEWRPFDKEILTKIKELIDSHFSEHEQREVYKDWLDEHISQPAEWSEEDEHRKTDAIYFLESAMKHYADTSEIEKTIDWLKSLHPSWKPSEKKVKPPKNVPPIESIMK